MVAKPNTVAQRFVSPPAPVLAGRWALVHFTRGDLDVLLRQGVVPEDATTELLSGMIALKDRAAQGEALSTVGRDHARCVELLSNLRSQISRDDRHVESQQPLLCREDHVPEPDFMILRGSVRDYTDLPTASDAYCVVEVADSSYERDAGEKLIEYAMAGIPQYIILNLRNRTAEVYAPSVSIPGSYELSQTVTIEDSIPLRVGPTEIFPLPLREILP